jgi:hypothetical protein
VLSAHHSSHVQQDRLALATAFVGPSVTAVGTGRGGVVQPVSGFSASEVPRVGLILTVTSWMALLGKCA